MLVTPIVLTLLASPQVADGALHGVFTAMNCDGPRIIGELIDCQVLVGYNDDFGDTVAILEGFTIVDPGQSHVRVPPLGNIEIVAVSGNTTAVVGGSMPVNIGPGGSTLSGLPGNPRPGVVTFRQDLYVVEPDDPDPLPVQANLVVADLCDAPGTIGCASVPALDQIFASIDIIFPAISLEVTASPQIVCQTEPSEVQMTYVLSNTGDVPIEDIIISNASCQPVVGPISGDVDSDGVLDVVEVFIDLNKSGAWESPEPIINDNGNGVWDDVEVWEFNCSAFISEATTFTPAVCGHVFGIPYYSVEASALVDVATHREFLMEVDDAALCIDRAVELRGLAPGAITFDWTGPVGFEATTQCVLVDTPGTYCCLAMDGNGCSVEDCGTVSLLSGMCQADVNMNGFVDFGDLLLVISNWGPCSSPCTGDLDCTGAVDFGDVLTVIGAWGPCP